MSYISGSLYTDLTGLRMGQSNLSVIFDLKFHFNGLRLPLIANWGETPVILGLL